MELATIIEILKNSPALLDGRLVISEEYIFQQLKQKIDGKSISIVRFSIEDQQLFFGFQVKRWGLHYQYEMDFTLRSVNLNSVPREFVFKENSSRVKPLNLLAKMLPFSTVFIPKIGPFLKFIVKIIIIELVHQLINQK